MKINKKELLYTAQEIGFYLVFFLLIKFAFAIFAKIEVSWWSIISYAVGIFINKLIKWQANRKKARKE